MCQTIEDVERTKVAPSLGIGADAFGDDPQVGRVITFANAEVTLVGMSLSSITAPIPLGIIAGLFVGKQLGVFGAAVSAIKLGIAEQPPGASLLQLYGIAILTGVGFTMSLSIGTLAFEEESLMAQVRLGVLVASVLSGLVAAFVLIVAARTRAQGR